MFKQIIGFFFDIIKQVLIKIITFTLVILIIIWCIKYFLNVDILALIGL